MLEKLTLTVAIVALLQLLAVNNPIFAIKDNPELKPVNTEPRITRSTEYLPLSES